MEEVHDYHDYRGLTTLSDEQRTAVAARAPGYAAAPGGMPTAQLSSGFSMPLVGLGTWKSDPGVVRAAVAAAVRAGYRHIDCASIYGNEAEVGAALAEVLAEGVVVRADLFITSKLCRSRSLAGRRALIDQRRGGGRRNTHHAATDVRPALEKTLADLGLEYVDLYLIHWPVVAGCSGPTLTPSTAETWAAMEACASAGLARSIGLSNFSARKLGDLLAVPGLRVRPAVLQVEAQGRGGGGSGDETRQTTPAPRLQVEAHPFWPNAELLAWARGQGLHVTAYSPLGSPDSAAIMQRADTTKRLLEDPQVLGIARRLGKSAAQARGRSAAWRGAPAARLAAAAARAAADGLRRRRAGAHSLGAAARHQVRCGRLAAAALRARKPKGAPSHRRRPCAGTLGSVLPKSANPERIKANLDVLTWSLPEEDQAALSSLGYRCRMVGGGMWLNPKGPYRTLSELWDEEEEQEQQEQG
ncbi:Akr1a1 [Scenedesmus sp. PABB004]|nr:Akr1a1 [Scenedesmus sp. PABB004]